jgi:hypothetical protein
VIAARGASRKFFRFAATPRTHQRSVARYAIATEPLRREVGGEILGSAVSEAVRGLAPDLALIDGEALALRVGCFV